MIRVGLGIDMGGTQTKILAVSESGRTLRREVVSTSPRKGPASFIRRVAAVIRRLERGLGRTAESATLAVAGDVDVSGGILRRAPNVSAFERYPLGDALSRALKRPVTVQNDANMAAWCAYARELGRRFPNVVALTMGTGIGGGVILDGKLFTGATGSAGEVGHMRIYSGGALCGCGARGCLEAYAGKGAVTRQARELLEARPGVSALSRRKSLEPDDIARAALAGDPVAREVWRKVGESLGLGIVNIVYLFNPDVIVLAGGLSQAAPLFLKSLRRILRCESFRAPFGRVKIRVAQQTEQGALGAALYSLESPH